MKHQTFEWGPELWVLIGLIIFFLLMVGACFMLAYDWEEETPDSY